MKDQWLGAKGKDNLRDSSILEAPDEFLGKGVRIAHGVDKRIDGVTIGTIDMNGALDAVGNS
jgi:hypothetical protein